MDLNDEVICGHLVSAKQKRVNAVFLDLLQVFDQLCQERGLTYWVHFGAMLGAVRHKGFIPWDDDVDLMMPRADFDRLAAMDSAAFGAKEPYFLQTPVSDPQCYQTLLRFRRSDTTYLTADECRNIRAGRPLEYNLGISLAIFPLDNLPAGKLGRTLQEKYCYLLRGVQYRCFAPAPGKRLQHGLCMAFRALQGGPRKMMDRFQRLYRRVGTSPQGLVQSFSGGYSTPTAWPGAAYAQTVRVPFEDIAVPIPAGYDDILRITYGDYMSFPPESEREKALHGELVDPDRPYGEVTKELLGRAAAGG